MVNSKEIDLLPDQPLGEKNDQKMILALFVYFFEYKYNGTFI
ncbi:MAG TPA: hypothetical protein VJ892_04585 [Candidatus Absconditabacterales bacterium]|nr:hypothetical protein [Candidatus Absconditabacterales bacterium]